MPLIRFKWRTHLKSALSESDVLALIRAYLAEWTEAERRRLPPDVFPPSIESRRDVLAATFRIGHAHSTFAGGMGDLALLQELLLFMTQASVRITQLAAAGTFSPGEGPSGGARRPDEDAGHMEVEPIPDRDD